MALRRKTAGPGRRDGALSRAARAVARRRVAPHLSLLRAPVAAPPPRRIGSRLSIATYNVHRWTGLNGRTRPDPARAAFVISELDVDVIALQEVLRPLRGDDPLEGLADALGLHVVFAVTRAHRHGHIGNAILSRSAIAGVSMLDLSYTRMEKRVAVSARFETEQGALDVVATHLALGDRTRHRQVRTLLDHPQLQATPTVLLGDMNAWRQCKATRALESELASHDNRRWPASFPAARPVLALDRIYVRGVRLLHLEAHASPAARRASDHLPIVATLELG